MLDKIINLGIGKPDALELIKVSNNIDRDYKKLLKGYPIQYLIGYSSFCGYKILINRNVLIPRFETETLVDKTINYINKYIKEDIKIVDLGTGSGCISIALAKSLKKYCITGIDISSKALMVAKKNAKENGVNINFIKNDMLKNINEKFNVIISNPPYIDRDEKIQESVKKYEPHKALYAKNKGSYYYNRILKESVNVLEERSIIAFEIRCYSQANEIKELALQYYPNSKIVIEKDLTERERYLFLFNNCE